MNARKPDQATATALALTNVILALLITGFTGSLIYARFFYEPTINSTLGARYAAEAKERLTANADQIQNEVTSLAQTLVPPITQAVRQQAREDFGLYIRTIENEGDEFLTNVESIFIAKVKAHYHEFIQQHEQVLKEEFPEHVSDDNVQRVLTEFERTLDRLIERYYLDEFRREARRTAELWKQFELVELPLPQAPSLGEQLADYAADWTVLSATDLEYSSSRESQQQTESP